MADETPADSTTTEGSAAPDAAPAKRATRKTAAKKAPAEKTTTAKRTAAKKAPAAKTAAAKTTAAKKTATKRTTKKAAVAAPDETLPGVDTPDTPDTPAEVPVEVPAAAEATAPPEADTETAAEVPAKRTAKKAAAKKTAAKKTTAAKRTTAKRTTKKAVAPVEQPADEQPADEQPAVEQPAVEPPAAAAEAAGTAEDASETAPPSATAVLFQAPAKKTTRKRTTRKKAEPVEAPAEETAETAVERPAEEQTETSTDETAAETAARTPAEATETTEPSDEPAESAESAESTESAESAESAEESGGGRRRRRRGGRRRRKSGGGDSEGADAADAEDSDGSDENGDEGDTGTAAESGADDQDQSEGSGTSRRRRRRRRAGEASGEGDDDNPPNTVTKVRHGRSAEDQITALSGSTRLEAKKQRRREGREAGRRRAPIVSEAEFLARRESVERVMVIRQREDLTQIGVLEDKVLVEHYVARESQTSLIGNVYLGKVQNVLPSMEAAFIDIGKGRNAVLYAGEVNWSSLGWKEGQPRKIESVLTSGQKVLVQVTKDPIGHKGARLTSQISLAGRFLVYVPDGTTSGISRKLPDTERNRLKTLLKEIVPDSAGVIVRTAAEGASEEELTRDVERLKARWEEIEKKAGGSAPQLLYGEPDLTLKVVRDLFTEDFAKLVIQGDDAWETVQGYVSHVAPDLEERLERYEPENGKDAFAAYRIDEQIAKGLDRKVWLPSGGSLIIDRTEAMTVIDVNTGKFTGSGGNLEETVTKNNLEAAEEIVRQLRLRDIGGIIVVDFIDMVLESNRDLVLRRLVECLGRDRTRHQVAEVTSLGLVQMTRKRIGTGLLEAFSESCEHCGGRGLVIHDHPVESGKGGGNGGNGGGAAPDEPRRRRRGGRGRGNGDQDGRDSGTPQAESPKTPSPAEFAAMVRHEEKDDGGAAVTPTGTDDETSAAPAADEAAVTPLEPVAVAETETEPAVEEPKVATPTSAEPAVAAAPQPAEAVAPAEPEAPAEPAKPKVVTRTRRRAASRPAGSPEQSGDVQPMVVEAAAVVVPSPEPVTTPEPPKVVTRTRRGASRPAGATLEAPTGSGAADAPAETPVDGLEDETHVEHVPIKKKGSRKR